MAPPTKTGPRGIPLPVWIGAGLFAIVVGYFFLSSSKQQQQSATDLQGAAGTTDATTTAQETYAAFLNQNSWLNSYLAQISQQLAGIASTQGASAPPNPSPPPQPPPSCCAHGFLCTIGAHHCPPHHPHDGSGIMSPAEFAKVA